MSPETERIINLWGNGAPIKKIAEMVNNTEHNVRSTLAKNGYSTKSKETRELKASREFVEEKIINADSSQISAKKISIKYKTKADVLKAHDYDIKEWILVSARSSKYDQQVKDVGVEELQASRITVKPRTEISVDEIIGQFKQLECSYKHKEYEYKNILTASKMLEVYIADLHFGKMAWAGETGENFDFKIAERRLLGAIADIIERVKHRTYEKIILPIGNDFFNFDTIAGTTTLGTAQDNDLRWAKLYQKGFEMCLNMIESLRKVAPVEIFYIPGNHDKMTSFYLVNEIWAWYRRETNVDVNTSVMARKYIKYGNSLLGFSHGDKEKKRLAGIMQVESAKDWGNTKYREWHIGHLHSQHTKEENGLVIKNMSSLTGTDAWHYESGYTGAICRLPFLTWDKKFGLIAEEYSIIE